MKAKIFGRGRSALRRKKEKSGSVELLERENWLQEGSQAGKGDSRLEEAVVSLSEEHLQTIPVPEISEEQDAPAASGELAPAVLKRVPVLKTYKLYINGSFVRSESGRCYQAYDASGATYANLCLASRKDFREAVVAARHAFARWNSYSAYNRGQVLYRVAEMMEGRRSQFIEELTLQGLSKSRAQAEVYAAIDQVIYYAGWCDKYQQVFSSVNPVASSYFNFSIPEPMGVAALLPPAESPLLVPLSILAAALAGANTAILLADQKRPLCMLSLAEVLHSSDLPGGVVNILSGNRRELLDHIASHMDVNALIYCGVDPAEMATLEKAAVENMKRVVARNDLDWSSPQESRNPYWILETQEIKTTWHPIEKIASEGSSY